MGQGQSRQSKMMASSDKKRGNDERGAAMADVGDAGGGGGGGGGSGSGKPKKLKLSEAANSADEVVGIVRLPDTLLVSISEHLSLPSRALFTAALGGVVNERSNAISQLVAPSDMQILDFPEIDDKEMAMRLSDDDLRDVLICINATNNLKKLKLAHCLNIVGHGLEPLRDSTVLEQIDLSLVGRFESPLLGGGVVLSESAVLPVLQSIVDVEGTSFKHVVFPNRWSSATARDASDQRSSLRQFVRSYSQCFDQCVYCRRPTIHHVLRTDADDPWAFFENLQSNICYDCCIQVCSDCGGIDGKCKNCEKVSCEDCVPFSSGCDWCSTMDEGYRRGAVRCGVKAACHLLGAEDVIECLALSVIRLINVMYVGEDFVTCARDYGAAIGFVTTVNGERDLCHSCCNVECCESCDVEMCNDCQPGGGICKWCASGTTLYRKRVDVWSVCCASSAICFFLKIWFEIRGSCCELELYGSCDIKMCNDCQPGGGECTWCASGTVSTD